MPKQPHFEPIAGMDGFYEAFNGKLRCVAIELGSGGFCLYSPISGLTADMLDAVEFILAPNIYHNKAVAACQAVFPQAAMLAPKACHERLTKVTGVSFDALEDADLAMPAGTRLVYPEGLKTGEVWISTSTGLVVVDAFAGPGSSAAGVQLLKPFPRYGLGDAAIYRPWVRNFLKDTEPQILVPCHGGIARDATLKADMLALVEAL